MHEQFLQHAIKLANKNVIEKNGGPYGAIIVKNEQLISASANRVSADVDPTAHAEILAIRQACKTLNNFKLSDCILYSSCEPCPMCLGAIYWARIKTVYFASNRLDAAKAGFDDSFIYEEINLAPEKRQIAMFHIDLHDANSPFLLWNSQQDKTPY